MNGIILIGNFLLSAWLWSITFDWYHLIINLFLMAFLFRSMSHASYWRALLFSFLLQVVAYAFFTAIVVGVLHYSIGWEYVIPEAAPLPVANYIMRACLGLGLIYATIQTAGMFAWHLYEPFSLRPYLIIIWMGNFISAILSYCCILILNSVSL